MKKKKAKKLTLNRETVIFLEKVVGGITVALRCGSDPCGHPGEGGTGGSPSIFDTCGACSNGCATGGACTVTCGACSDAC